MVIGTQLPEGSNIGVRVTDGGADYQGTDYSHVRFTSSGTGDAQKWTAEPPVYLSGQSATIYAYSPYQSTEGFEITAIPVDMTEQDQTDWLYATPITGPCDSNPKADITLNHALTAFTLSFHKEGYPGAGEVTAVKIQSPALATGGTLDATAGEFTAVSGQGDVLTRTATFTLGDAVTSASTVQVMVVPTALKAALNITVTVDGKDYTAATASMNFIAGHNYALTMNLTAKELKLDNNYLTDWVAEDIGSGTLISETVRCWLGVETISIDEAQDGIYAVAPTGRLVKDIESINSCAASDCVAVALVVNNAPVAQYLWIEKYEYENSAWGGFTQIVWQESAIDLEIPNYGTVDGTSDSGWLPMPDGHYTLFPELNPDYTIWDDEGFVLSDFNGKENTRHIMELRPGYAFKGWTGSGLSEPTVNVTVALELSTVPT